MRFLVLFLVVHQIFADSESGQLDSQSFASGINGFSLEFAKKLDYANSNLIFSPLSIAMSVAMLLKGAQGKTSNDMYKMLNMLQYSNKDSIHTHFKSLMGEYEYSATRKQNPRNVLIELANALIVAEGYNLPQTYSDALKTDYEATVSKENFATNGQQVMEKINRFIKERTHDLIPNMLKEPLDATTVLVLLNTLFFKGYWQEPFYKAYTHNATFFNSDKTEATIEMMSAPAASHRYYHCNEHNASIIELKYEGDVSMFVQLPDDKYGLPKLIENWTKDKLSSYIPQMNYTTVKVFLPKFENKLKSDLLKIFDKMNTDIRPALSSLDPALKFSSAIHQANIKVFEAGTEAAAVTILSVNGTSAIHGPKQLELRADHPFAYVIRDMKSNVNLFCGVVNNFH